MNNIEKLTLHSFVLLFLVGLMVVCTFISAAVGIILIKSGKIGFGIFQVIWSLVCWLIAMYDWGKFKEVVVIVRKAREEDE